MLDIMNESVAQKDRFRIAANKLLNHCFLIKKKPNTKAEYFFVLQNKEFFFTYFDLLGYQLIINEEQGVIGIVNQFGTGRYALTKYESIMLLIMRLLYIEKRKEIGSFSQEVTVLMEEIREKYSMLKVKSKPVMDKTMEREIISMMKRFHLVMNIEADVTQADTRIIIYPSIFLAVGTDQINEYYNQIQDRLRNYAGGEDDGELEEAADQSQAD